MINLTQKERMLLQDQKSHEELCIKKYNNYANQAHDPQLKQLFTQHAQQEQQHLNTLNQILNGQVPNLNQQGQQNQALQMPAMQTGMSNQADADLCQDMLGTEKYVSSSYNTSIFEFRDHNIRQILNHIQKEEQEHGESIFKYMESKGMYQPQ
ncbi:spore coat protein [Caloramator sp. E03]|uniref:demethoxyubiquinone hydroxylase family protein n=1 Tax=Caloramator sp. E03 TaxID=2576307 RepID=UPI001110DF44|nr:demethoxyubiquinone hydroxylase family protein [Caloramator sp. E03]QCX32852.1 spore coat protein [Caloramator sp. E03]